jgi:GNAT superfamily N-acetyltransferase
MTPTLWEELVLAKPYFDREGLILAFEGARPVGFVHAGFGATEDLSDINRAHGAICMLMVVPHDRQLEIGIELTAAAEAYLYRRGATRILSGPAYPDNPYYLGIYGGSGQVGWLASDPWIGSVFRGLGYADVAQYTLWQTATASFQPTVDRTQQLVRRQYRATIEQDPPTTNWWRACTWGHVDRTRFDVLARSGGAPLASVWFWDIQPLAASWGVNAMGMARLQDTPQARQLGLTTFLLTEAIQEFRKQNVSLVAFHTATADLEIAAILKQLGALPYDHGVVLQK